jgi:guanosine-3',5'-bis(diphosphate) 3'-pyrophosphohydrolase
MLSVEDEFNTAVQLATIAHHTQRRKSSGDPYIVHPLRVGYLAVDARLPHAAQVAGVLHDVVEDTSITLADLAEKGFSADVLDCVDRLTKWWPSLTSKENKRQLMTTYYDRILASQNAINIKLLDRIDNLVDMVRLLPQQTRWATRYLTETETEFEPIYAGSDNVAIQQLYLGTIKILKARLGTD